MRTYASVRRQGLQRASQQSQRRSRLQQPLEPQLSGRKRDYQQLNEVRAEVPLTHVMDDAHLRGVHRGTSQRKSVCTQPEVGSCMHDPARHQIR